MNTEQILFRCSQLGKLMTEPKSKSETLSETTKDYLLDVFINEYYGRHENIVNKYVQKGKHREEDSITLVSRYFKKMFKKNDVRLTNDYLTGEVDIFDGESIQAATHTIDTKTSWSMQTFFKSKKAIDKMYYWQGQGYMALTGASKHTVAHCLVNSPDYVITDEKKKIAYSMHVLDPSTRENEEYVQKCKQVEINHIFDIQEFMNEYPWFEFDNDVNHWAWDVPAMQRIHIQTFERNDEEIERLYKRIDDCREFIENLKNSVK